MRKRVAIATIGTSGDVRPYLALAKELQNHGHDVVLGTNSDFEDLVRSYDVEFHSLGTRIQDWLQESRFDNAISGMKLHHFPQLLREGQALVERAARNAWAMSQGADAIVVNINTSFGIDIAEALDIPVVMTAMQPLNPTREFPVCAYEVPDLGPTFNKLSYIAMNLQQAYYDMPRDRLRKNLMGLPARKRGGLFKDSYGNTIPTLYNFSAIVSPRPRDWPQTAVVTGFWHLDDNSGWTPPPELQAFLDAGPPPVYIGFGSMPFGADRNTQILRSALEQWGGRAIVSRGWGGINPADLPDTVFAVTEAPHDKLFPLVSAVIHHGGAGTTAAGLRAGKPTFTVPQAYDQRYWGRRVRALGCGPAPVRLRALTPEKLASALHQLTSNPNMAANAKSIGKALSDERGLETAVAFIETTIDGAKAGARRFYSAN
ncbi:glycosyltransferase family 1 protein [Devosia sp. PTR5]|uniref:Glycosyltransferase family 1 protein n=1 Tax=Devosia oryzisoli TaxID=2774138 RepID=A0A927FRJ5_9HYPH|nr:glycosyltransferase [Devosia oryzisoli]MBD8064930.1 glycosyltransferase family 1 protein [Devosia oryzisoli]